MSVRYFILIIYINTNVAGCSQFKIKTIPHTHPDYLPLSGGELYGNLKAPIISAESLYLNDSTLYFVNSTLVVEEYLNSQRIKNYNNTYLTVNQLSSLWGLSGDIGDLETDPKFTTWAITYTGNWNDAISEFKAQSATNDNLYSFVNSNSSQWVNTEHVNQTLSYDEITFLLSISGGNSVSLSSLNGGTTVETDPKFTTWANTYSSSLIDTLNTVSNNSASNWNYQGNDIKSLTSNWEESRLGFSSQSANNNLIFNAVASNSASWDEQQTLSFNETTLDLSISNGNSVNLSALSSPVFVESDPVFTTWAQTFSSKYDDVFNTVNSNSSTNWNYQGTDVKSLTSNWESTYGTVLSLSSNWDSEEDPVFTTWANTYSADLQSSKNTTTTYSASWNEVYTNVVNNSSLYLSAFDPSYLESLLATGSLSGGLLSISNDPTKFNISAGRGKVVNSWINTLDPTVIDVSWGSMSALSATYLTTNTFTHVYINSAGSVVQSDTNPTAENFRDSIYLGQLAHTNQTTINSVLNVPVPAWSPNLHLQDLTRSIGIINKGNAISANGANLQLNKSSGTLEYFGINYENSLKSPNIKNFNSGIGITFRMRTQSGNGSTTNILDVGHWDVGGTVTAFSGTKAQNMRVFLTVAGNVVIQYGQTEYNSLVSALAGLQSESFNIFENLVANSALIGIISVESNATSLLDSTKCRILPVSKFGEIVGASAGISVTTLQQAYNNSTTPEIVTDSSRGALTIRRGSLSETDKVLNIENGSGTERLFIDGQGILSSNNTMYALEGNSIQWSSVYTTVQTNSATTWNYQGNDLKSLSGNWQNTCSIVQTNSAQWAVDSTVDAGVRALTSNWQNTYLDFTAQSPNNISVYTTVNTNSAVTWNYQGNDLKSVSGNWQNTFTTVQTNSSNWNIQPLRVSVPLSDQTSNLTTGTKYTFTWRYGTSTLSSTPVDIVEAPAGSSLILDVKKNTVSIYSTKPSIDDGEFSTDTALTAAVISATTINNGDIIAISIDQIGASTAGKGVVMTFIGTTVV